MTTRSTLQAASVLASIFYASFPVAAQVYMFGSDNDGLAGFAQSTTDPTQESWSTQAGSVRYINDDPDGIDAGVSGGTRDASLLRSISLDRSVGKSYKMEGVVTLTDGYADDNNRVGIYLFGDFADIPGEVPPPTDEEAGALYLHYNSDVSRNQVLIDEGLDGPNQALEVKDAGVLGEDLFGTDLAFEAVIDFVDVGGTNMINVTFTMTDAADDVTTISTSVIAANYTGDYFGFATRARNRGTINLDRVDAWTMDYRSFSVTDVSQPSALPLSITDVAYLPSDDMLTFTWTATTDGFYRVQSSTDLASWDGEIGDGLSMAEHDEDPGDGDHLTETFDLSQHGLQGETDLFFRVMRE